MENDRQLDLFCLHNMHPSNALKSGINNYVICINLSELGIWYHDQGKLMLSNKSFWMF